VQFEQMIAERKK